MAKPTHAKVQGTGKKFVYFVATVFFIISFGGFASGSIGSGILLFLIGAVIAWLGSKIPDRDQFTL